MPKRRTDDVVHVVMTDHYIQRRKPGAICWRTRRNPRTEANSYRGEVVLYYPAHPVPTSGIELDTAMAQIADPTNVQEGLAELRG